jgi:WD40 repeat protein
MHRTDAFAHILVCSPDGSMLASADPSGTVTLLKFSTLRPLHRITAIEAGIQGLCFCGDGQQLLDTRGSRCRVWEPTVLLRQNAHSSPSSKASTPREACPELSYAGSEPVLITSIVCHDNGDAFFCGKEDGAVYHYHSDSGLQSSRLYSHANGVVVVSLSFHHSSNALTSVDASGRVMVRKLSSQGRAIVASEVLFDHRADAAVSQVMCRPDLDRFLICSTKSDNLWCLSQEAPNPIASKGVQQQGSRGWVNHPLSRACLLLITQTAAYSFDWLNIKALAPEA